MNPNSLKVMLFPMILTLTSSVSLAATFDSRSYNVRTTVILNNQPTAFNDQKGPAVSGLLDSFQSITPDTTPNSITETHASANGNGQAAVQVDGLYGCAGNQICDFSQSAKANYQVSYTNNSSTAVRYTYTYTVNDIVVELRDDLAIFGSGVNGPTGPTASATSSVSVFVDNSNVDSVFSKMDLVGGALGHSLNKTGITTTPTNFQTADTFGYRLGSLTGSFSGTLTAGQTLKIFNNLEATLFLHGDGNLPVLQTVGLVGGRASIGDPNNLAISPLEGTLTITAVPIPGAVWLFGSGLMGLTGMSRRHRLTG